MKDMDLRKCVYVSLVAVGMREDRDCSWKFVSMRSSDGQEVNKQNIDKRH